MIYCTPVYIYEMYVVVWVADNKRMNTSTYCSAQGVSTVCTHNRTHPSHALSLVLIQAMNTHTYTFSSLVVGVDSSTF